MKTLGEFAQEKSNFVSLEIGKPFSAIYRGYKFIEKEVRGETKEYVRYLLENLDDNKVRNLDSQSGALARKMEQIPNGAVVKITKTGEGFDTKYEVDYGEMKTKTEEIKEEEIPIIEEDET